MSDYVQSKVVDALKKNKGVRSSAKRDLARLCGTDEMFLRELVGHHLGAIIDHAMAHYAHTALGNMNSSKSKVAANAGNSGIPLGKEMLSRFASQNTPVFGMDDPSQGTGKRPQASSKHRDAIAQIAKIVDKNSNQ